MRELPDEAALWRRLARAAGRVMAHVGAGLVDIWVMLSLLLALQSYRDGVEATWHHLRVVNAVGAWWLLGVLGLGVLLAWLNALLFNLRLGEPDAGPHAGEAAAPVEPPAAKQRQEPVLE